MTPGGYLTPGAQPVSNNVGGNGCVLKPLNRNAVKCYELPE